MPPVEVSEKITERSVRFEPKIPSGENRAAWLQAHRDEIESAIRRRLAELAVRERIRSYEPDDVGQAVGDCCAGRSRTIKIGVDPADSGSDRAA